MTIKTKFNIGDIADFHHDGKSVRIRVDQINVQTLDHIPIAKGKILIEYRQINENGSTPWQAEAWAK